MTRLKHTPRWVYIPAAIGLLLVGLPLVGLFPRVQWSTFIADITAPQTAAALWLSVRSAFFAVIACVVIGLPLALVIARAPRRVARVMRTLVTLPLVLPPLVGGVALLTILGKTGIIGKALSIVSVSVPFTPAAVTVAQTFVAMPFLVIATESALRAHGTRFEDVASTLGSRPHHTLTRVTLPLIAPGLGAGMVLAFARAVGEFGATALVAGNQPGYTQTIPMAIYTAFNGVGTTRQAAMALSVLLIVASLAILIAFPQARGARGPSPRALKAPTREPEPVAPVPVPTGLKTIEDPSTLQVAAQFRRPGFTLDVDLDLNPAEVVAVVGPNGAGKTTLLNLISGTLTPTSGHISIGEHTRVTPQSSPPPWERHVSVLTQDPLLFPHLNVRANIAFGIRARSRAQNQLRDLPATLLQAVDMTRCASDPVHTLSGGQQQRVALARALAVNPAVLLLDEPLAQVDVANAPALRHTLKTLLGATSTTTIIVTHSLLDVAVLADRVLVLEDGKVIESQTRNEFLTHPRSPFGAMFTGRNVLVHPKTGELLTFEPHQLHLSYPGSPVGGGGVGWNGMIDQVEVRGTKAFVHVRVEERTVRIEIDIKAAPFFFPGQSTVVEAFLDESELKEL